MSTREENHEYALAIIEAKNAEIMALRTELGLAVVEAGKLRAELAQAKLLKPRTGAAHE